MKRILMIAATILSPGVALAQAPVSDLVTHIELTQVQTQLHEQTTLLQDILAELHVLSLQQAVTSILSNDVATRVASTAQATAKAAGQTLPADGTPGSFPAPYTRAGTGK